jgi:hypothetical protein
MYRGTNYRKASDVFKFRLSPNGNNNISTLSSSENFTPIPPAHPVQNIKSNNVMNVTNITRYNKNADTDIREPEVFGPSMWFTLHNGAIHYPKEASPIVAEKMKGFILGFPYMIPCEKCQHHAIAYIEEHCSSIDEAIKGSDSLFMFFWKFHNYVNERLNKPQISLENAKKLYSENSTIKIMNYT